MKMPENFDSLDDMMEDLMLQGAIEIVGVDAETGEFLYTFTQKLAEINPKIYQAMIEDFHSSIMRLWEAGFLSMDITSENPIVKATEKVFDKESIAKLSKNDQIALEDILNKMSE
jgi:hypothetical protein